MTVYVDDMNMEHNGKVWCHMVADTEKELHEFAEWIGLRRSWCHVSTVFGKPAPHYDLTAQKKRQALSVGAQAITTKEALLVIRRMQSAKETEELPFPEPPQGDGFSVNVGDVRVRPDFELDESEE